jgi:hypothetical protein
MGRHTMSGNTVGIAEATSSERSGRGLLLGFALTAVLLAAGLIAVSGSVQAAPSDAPSVRSLDEIQMEGGQSFELVAENTNDDKATEWDYEATDDSLEFQERTSDDNRTYYLRTDIPSSYGDGDGFRITVNATDGQGLSDASETILYMDADGELESARERINETGELVESVPENTDVDLRVDADDNGHVPNITGVDVDKNHPDGFTRAAENVTNTWEAGPFSYELPGTREVGYTLTDASDAKFTVIDELEVTERAPEVAVPDQIVVDQGQRLGIVAEATVFTGDPAEWQVDVPKDDAVVTTSENESRVQWKVPWDADRETFNVTFTATDSRGLETTGNITVKVRPDLDPDADPEEPRDIGIDYKHPIIIVGEDTELLADYRYPATFDNVTFLQDWQDLESELDVANVGGDTFRAQTTFDTPGDIFVGYGGSTDDGGFAGVLQDVLVKNAEPAKVDAEPSRDDFDGKGYPDLRGHFTDPDLRLKKHHDFEWALVDSPVLDEAGLEELVVGTQQHDAFQLTVDNVEEATGEEISSVSGEHSFELRVTDPYGETGTDQLTVVIDDFVTADAKLTNADGQLDDGTYIYDPIPSDGLQERVVGEVSVLDDGGNPVEGATVEGTVFYTQALLGVAVNSFEVETDASGVAEFGYNKAVAGSVGLDESITDLPGDHEIDITVTAENSDVEATPDENTAETLIPYHVGNAGTAALTG